MIPYIDAQMSAWGRWVVRRSSRGLGFPGVCPMFRDSRFGGAYGASPPPGVVIGDISDILDTDAAVQRLDAPSRSLATEYYVVGGKGLDVAARLGIARRTMYDRIHALHQAMLGHLNDVAAGC